jgi:hypothetical protein
MNMKFILRTVVLMFILSAVSYAEEPLPKVYLVKPASLAKVKASFAAGEKTYLPALKKLERDAEKALRFKPVSVMEKEQIPPSGNKHDYMSLSKYWWPDPDKSDGLPYIRKDGEVNPETNKIPDHENLNKVILAVSTLGQAYYFNGEEKYAESNCCAAFLVSRSRKPYESQFKLRAGSSRQKRRPRYRDYRRAPNAVSYRCYGIA